ncbi:MAG: 2,3-bisphosphoglycerate-independent phosphoglycerate mutase [Deltaproteobacteria bacterium]|nr:2,3-bisphosphoglycerate-independent phosphoglycerate mutase [Deltaproteobacteria bacterium]
MTVERLARHPRLPKPAGPIVLCILDGVGWGARDGGDAVHLARTPHLDALWRGCPTRTLRAHGTAVGLPSDADMGNSEVGHNALGAGRVFEQGAALVNQAIASGRLFAGEAWRWLVEPLRSTGTLHLCGLLSDGNVHAHLDHVLAIVRRAAGDGVRRVRVHALADGRDVQDPSFEHYLALLQAVAGEVADLGCDAQVASGGGRMAITMDRYEADWSMVERGWRLHVHGDGELFPSVDAALRTLRARPGGASDQTLGGFVIADAGGPVGAVLDGDAFVLWNFRGDRAIELSKAFEQGGEFCGFERGRRPAVRFAGMMQYDGDLHLPARFLVEPPAIDRTLGVFLAALELRSFAVSETQKFGHVTYFWNGNKSGVLAPEVERYAEVPSDRVSFDRAPEMKAEQITDAMLSALNETPQFQFLRCNLANGDMVGHTGDLGATVRAVEAVDRQVGRLREAVLARNGILVVTADHGNADDMWMRDGKGRPILRPDGSVLPKTSHTLAPVPLTICDARSPAPWRLRADLPQAGLAHVAATLLHLLGYEAPGDYAPSLVDAAA